jgi:hypothetical protein
VASHSPVMGNINRRARGTSSSPATADTHDMGSSAAPTRLFTHPYTRGPCVEWCVCLCGRPVPGFGWRAAGSSWGLQLTRPGTTPHHARPPPQVHQGCWAHRRGDCGDRLSQQGPQGALVPGGARAHAAPLPAPTQPAPPLF